MCLNDLLESVNLVNKDYNIALPATTSLRELQEDLMLSTSSEESIIESHQASTPINTDPNSPIYLSSIISSIDNLVQEQTPSITSNHNNYSTISSPQENSKTDPICHSY
ncbi:hypothetical protein NPIL_403361 [Nephila pilipes]|uniref:Uncharacterized protein n=1 Tax=Nephila pilipes TaxID=299642 RepID=A0A8X6P083_NEPPI|nr:hypothetical protein NPIL_403361 [Nephila pilipes]